MFVIIRLKTEDVKSTVCKDVQLKEYQVKLELEEKYKRQKQELDEKNKELVRC